jgi:hypothetical protein
VLDGAQHLLGGGVLLAQHAPLGGCLDHDHAQAVGDHVVQLPRDPGALVDHRGARLGLLVPLQQGGAVLERGGELLAAAQHPAQDPRQGVQEPAVDVVGRDRAGQHCRRVDGQDGRGRQHAPDDGAPPVGVGGDRVDRQQEGQERVGVDLAGKVVQRVEPDHRRAHDDGQHRQGRAPAPAQRHDHQQEQDRVGHPRAAQGHG